MQKNIIGMFFVIAMWLWCSPFPRSPARYLQRSDRSAELGDKWTGPSVDDQASADYTPETIYKIPISKLGNLKTEQLQLVTNHKLLYDDIYQHIGALK